MPTLRGAVLAVCTVLFCATLAPGARADQWDKKTIVTFGDAVEIPGQVLPAGTYVFKLADTLADRHIVQIWNADETQIFATIRNIPNTRFEPPDTTIFEFDESSAASPSAVKVCFYPVDITGPELIYVRYSNNQYAKFVL